MTLDKFLEKWGLFRKIPGVDMAWKLHHRRENDIEYITRAYLVYFSTDFLTRLSNDNKR